MKTLHAICFCLDLIPFKPFHSIVFQIIKLGPHENLPGIPSILWDSVTIILDDINTSVSPIILTIIYATNVNNTRHSLPIDEYVMNV